MEASNFLGHCGVKHVEYAQNLPCLTSLQTLERIVASGPDNGMKLTGSKFTQRRNTKPF